MPGLKGVSATALEKATRRRAPPAAAAVGGGPAPQALRGLVALQECLVEVDGGEVAEGGDGDVEEFAGGGVQVEAGPDARGGVVEQGEVAPGVSGLAGGGVAAGDVGADRGDAEGASGAVVDAVEVDRPVAPFAGLGVGGGPGELEVVDRVAGVQDAVEGGAEPVGLARGEVVLGGAAAVGVGGAAEDGGEPLVGPLDAQVGAEEQEADGRLAENRLRGGQSRLDAPQGADVHHDADGGPVPRLGTGGHHVDLGQPLAHRGRRGRRERCGGGRGGRFRDGCAGCGLAGAGRGQPDGQDAGPLLAVEDLGHLAVAAFAQVARDEGVDGVAAEHVLGADAEEPLGAVAPLVDQPVGADREGGDLDVVVDRPGWAALPHDPALRSW